MGLSLFLLLLLLLYFWPTFSLKYYQNLYRKGKEEEKNQALEKLASLDNPRALGVFLDSLLEANSQEERSRRGEVISRWMSPEGVSLLIGRLKNPSLNRQKTVLLALPYLKGLDFVRTESSLWKIVRRLAYSSQEGLRRGALESLAAFPSHAKGVYFLDGLHSIPGGFDFLPLVVQYTTSKDLELFFERLSSNREEDRKNAALALSTLIDQGKNPFPLPQIKKALYPCLKDKSDLVRFYGVLSFQKIGTSEDLSRLLPLKGDDDEDIRQTLAIFLGRMGRSHPEARQALRELRKDSSQKVREEALLSLGKSGDLGVIGPLMDLVRNRRSLRRIDAIVVLGEMKTREALSLMEEVLEDPEGHFRTLPFRGGQQEGDNFKAAAARALGEIGNKRTITLLLKYITYSFSEKVRQTALKSALKLGPREWILPTIKQKLAETSSPTEKKYLQEALKQVGKGN